MTDRTPAQSDETLREQIWHICRQYRSNDLVIDAMTGELEQAIRAWYIAQAPEKLVNTKDESDTDYFYGYGYNAAIDAYVRKVRGEG